MAEYLYVICRRDDGVRKVGRSCEPLLRMNQLCREIGGDLELEHQAECPPDQVAKAESYAHYLLRECRYSGELFSVDADTARQAIDTAAQIAAVGGRFPIPEPQRMNICVPTNMRREIKKWQHQNLIDTEGEAVRRLLRLALKSHGMM